MTEAIVPVADQAGHALTFKPGHSMGADQD
jgi:hypothetical protein